MSSEKPFPSKKDYELADKLASENKTDQSFIKEYTIDEELCDDLIEFFNKTPSTENTDDNLWYSKKPGAVGVQGQIRNEHKESIDLGFSPFLFEPNTIVPKEYQHIKNIYDKYLFELHKCTRKYIQEYPRVIGERVTFDIKEATNIQYYPPGGGFKTYHCERSSEEEPQSSRVLVFMTYLNTVTDEGGTHFIHQNKTVNAVKGKTVIWPCDWPWTHKGIISPTQEKYIVTGWYNFNKQSNVGRMN
tara:strand:+ start:1 stop:735 length:735 start_codon:yes stop_codon:yes gene_type:complete